MLHYDAVGWRRLFRPESSWDDLAATFLGHIQRQRAGLDQINSTPAGGAISDPFEIKDHFR